MRNKTGVALVAAALGVSAIIAMPAWAAGGNDRLMQVQMHVTMHMPGMPAMPPRTTDRQVCMPAKSFDPHAMQSLAHQRPDSRCTVEHFARHGDEITYDVMCKVPQTVTTHAVVRLTGDDGFTGTSHMTMDANGHTMTMDGQYSAKRVGSCTYKPPKKP